MAAHYDLCDACVVHCVSVYCQYKLTQYTPSPFLNWTFHPRSSQNMETRMLLTEYLWISVENLMYWRWGKDCSQYRRAGRFMYCCYQRRECRGVFKCAEQVQNLVRASERERVTAFQVMQCRRLSIVVLMWRRSVYIKRYCSPQSMTSCQQLHYLRAYLRTYLLM